MGEKKTPINFCIRKGMAILAVLLLLMATLPVASADNNWKYRRPITISNDGSALTNYQVLVHITDTSNMQDNGADLRFTNEANTVKYPYWVESWATNDAYVWVKVSSIPHGTSSMWMWYGNPDASSESDGDATFEFFDDFSGNTLDSDKWTEDAVNDISHTLNNYFRFEDATKSGNTYWIYDGTDTGSQHQAKWTPISNFIVEFTSTLSNTGPNQMGEGFVGLVADDDTIIAVVGHQDWAGGERLSWKGIVAEDNSGTIHNANYKKHGTSCYYADVSSDDTQNWEIEHYGTTIKVYDNDGLAVTLTRSSTLSKLALAAGAYGGHSYLDYVQIENLRVRKYADPEPTTEVGAQQDAGPVPPVPDLPAIILFGSGLLVIVYAVARGCSRR